MKNVVINIKTDFETKQRAKKVIEEDEKMSSVFDNAEDAIFWLKDKKRKYEN